MRRFPGQSPRQILIVLAAAAAAIVLPPFITPAQAQHFGRHRGVQCRERQYGQPDVFANYYTRGNCGGTPAQLYVAPLPVPPVVGNTYITYQPMMPHELLYPHYKSYHRYYDGGRGMTRAAVHWYYPPGAEVGGWIKNALTIPR